jgi:pre-rRNA-processing protein TSR4
MASSTQYWSDEDEDDAQIETSIHLGVPDGPVESASDLSDAAVSRIGGLPVRPISTQTCTSILLNIS